MHKRPKLLLVQASLHPPGGGNGLCAWMVEALKDRYDLEVLTWGPMDFDLVNSYFGTSISPRDFTHHTVGPVLRSVVKSTPFRLGLFRRMALLRHAQALASRFDLILTADGEADFGVRGIQYVHYPWLKFPRPACDMRWYHVAPLLRVYYGTSARLGHFSSDRMRQNLTLVNSEWTRTKVREIHGIDATVLYPPAAGEFPVIPWNERQNAFIAVGRIALEKRFESILAILRRVRDAGEPVRLTIVGAPTKTSYYRMVRRLVSENGAWVTLREDIPREELIQLLATHRYGIHAMHEEHFGMAIAEMVRAGCIVFAPSSGGQVEILDDERLLYESEEDAAAKILRVLHSPDEQHALLERLAPQAERFTADRFTSTIRELVEAWLSGDPAVPTAEAVGSPSTRERPRSSE